MRIDEVPILSIYELFMTQKVFILTTAVLHTATVNESPQINNRGFIFKTLRHT